MGEVEIFAIKSINMYIHPMPVLFTLILLITLVYTFLLKKIRDSYRVADAHYPLYQQGCTKTIFSIMPEDKPVERENGLENLYFDFDDIPGLSDNILRDVLIDTDSTMITQALFGSDKKIVSSIVRNLSETSRLAVKNELKRIGKKPPQEKIEEAKEVIAGKIQRGIKTDENFSNSL